MNKRVTKAARELLEMLDAKGLVIEAQVSTIDALTKQNKEIKTANYALWKDNAELRDEVSKRADKGLAEEIVMLLKNRTEIRTLNRELVEEIDALREDNAELRLTIDVTYKQLELVHKDLKEHEGLE